MEVYKPELKNEMKTLQDFIDRISWSMHQRPFEEVKETDSIDHRAKIMSHAAELYAQHLTEQHEKEIAELKKQHELDLKNASKWREEEIQERVSNAASIAVAEAEAELNEQHEKEINVLKTTYNELFDEYKAEQACVEKEKQDAFYRGCEELRKSLDMNVRMFPNHSTRFHLNDTPNPEYK